MAAPNTSPIYSKVGDLSSDGGTTFGAVLTAAANDYTGVSANNSLQFTADANNGGFVQRLRFKALGTNVATVARIYINNGSTPTTAANNKLIGELALPVTTSSATVPLPEPEFLMGYAIDPAFRIYVGLGTAVAAGWTVTPIAGKY